MPRLGLTALITLLIALALLAPVCSDDKEEARGSAEGEAQAQVEVQAQFGGQLIAVGDYRVELLPYQQGRIEAAVYNGQGAMVGADGNLRLVATVPTAAGAEATFNMGWDSVVGHFVAQSDKALKPGKVKLKIAGEAEGAAQADAAAQGNAEAEADLAVVIPPARIGGEALIAGDYAAEVRVSKDGLLEVALSDSKGMPVQAAIDAALKAEFAFEGGGTQTMDLAWHAPSLSYRASLGANADLLAKLPQASMALKAQGTEIDWVGHRVVGALQADSEFGGIVAVAGDHTVEVLPAADGRINAFVYDAQGKLVVPEADARLELAFAANSDAEVRVPMRWSAADGSFSGEVKAGAELLAGPMRVHWQGKSSAGVGGSYARAFIPEARFGGAVMAVGNYSAEVRAHADGKVEAFLNDSAGSLLAEPIEGQLEAKVQVAGQAELQPVALQWDADAKAYVGQLKAEGDAKIALAPGPVALNLKLNSGAEWHGSRHLDMPLPAPKHKGEIVLVGDHALELVAQGKKSIRAYVHGGAAADAAVQAQADAKVDANAEAKADADMDARYDLKLAVGGAPVAMKWNKAGYFEGKLTGKADFKTAPINVGFKAKANAAGAANAGVKAGAAANARAHAGFGHRLNAGLVGLGQANAKARANFVATAHPPSARVRLVVSPPALRARLGVQSVTAGRLDLGMNARAAAAAKANGAAGAGARGNANAGLKAGVLEAPKGKAKIKVGGAPASSAKGAAGGSAGGGAKAGFGFKAGGSAKSSASGGAKAGSSGSASSKSQSKGKSGASFKAGGSFKLGGGTK